MPIPIPTINIISYVRLEPSIRQQKIIDFLVKQTLDSSIIDSGCKFYKMLESKLQLADYKGLQYIINNLTINDEYKKNYANEIDNFISYLIKEKTKGTSLFKDKDISQLVLNITC